MRRISLLLVWGAAAAGLLQAQPTLTSLQSGYSLATGPQFGAAITSGTPLPSFALFINGDFSFGSGFVSATQFVSSVNWTNTVTGVSFNFQQVQFISSTQIAVIVPGNLFNVAQSAPQTVDITAYDGSTPSNTLEFTLNPPLAGRSSLPEGIVGQPYTAPIFSGGTDPYIVNYAGVSSPGSLPPGLSFQNSPMLAGAPTAAGLFTYQVQITDAWGNTLVAPESIFVVALPTIAAVVPAAAIAGSLAVPITVTGANFVSPSSSQQGSFSGTTIELFLGAGGPTVQLATTVVNSTTATATIPASFLTAPMQLGVAAQQPGAGASTILPFVVTGPVISSVSPASLTARSTPVTLTVSGSGFLASGSAAPAQSTILINGSPVATTFGNSGSLSASVVLATAGSVSVQVENPAGSLSNIVSITTLGQPAITNVTPNPFPGGRLTVTVTNLTSGMTVLFNGTAVPTTVANSGQLSATVPAAIYGGSSAQITVQTSDGFVTAPFRIQLASPVQITTTSLPGGTVQQTYDAHLAATGGISPYTWTASGLPPGLSINPASGEIAGTPTTAGTYSVSVGVFDSINQTASAQFPGVVIAAAPPPPPPQPTVTSVTPNPFLGTKLTVNGTNFTATMTVIFGGTALPTTFVNANQLSATVAPSLLVGTSALVWVQTTDGYSTPAIRIALATPPQITTATIPPATGQQPYDVKLSATGGTPPYQWTAAGLPAGLSINPATGEISGTPTGSGSFNISVMVTDSLGLSNSVRYQGSITTPPPPATPPQIGSGSPPAGFVGVSYNFAFSASSGNGNLNFGLGSGSLPPGLSLDTTGVLKGLPTTAGSYQFSVTVTDSNQLTATAAYTLVIKPQPLSITTPGPLATVTAGTPVSLKFAALGGIPPYTFSTTGNLPPGTSVAADGTFSGTATTAGSYSFTVVVNDSAQDPPGNKTFAITINPASLAVTAGLGSGQFGSPYSGQIGATGGVPPYTFAVTGLPDGLSFAAGAVTGTPATAGQYTVSVTVTDAAKTAVSASFPVSIGLPAVTISTTSLPAGTANSPYTATLNATGGTGQFAWNVTGLPDGLSATQAGAISGTPTTPGTYSVQATAASLSGTTTASASQTYSLVIAPAALTFTISSLANATAGASYSAGVTASGGVAPYTFTATGLPTGLSISPSGVITGTTTVVGTATVVITVKDSTGASSSRTIQLIVVLPPTPALTVTGLPGSSAPATQSTVSVGIGATYPVNITANLTLTFAADSGPDDPMVQFSGGGRAATLTIPAGSSVSATSIGVQTGTVAGTATVTVQLLAGSQDITPTPAPTAKVRIGSVAPVITSVTATATSGGFTVTVAGYATSRSMTQAVFTFTPASGVNLQTTTVTIPVATIFSTWYASSAAAAFGGQFSFSQPFNVTGTTSAVSSVSVTLTNGDGTSSAVSATVH